MADAHLDLPALLGAASPVLRAPGGGRASLPDGLIGSAQATVALYFSGQFCPPCKRFTPKLAAAYAALAKREDAPPREIVFVSADRTRAEFEAYADTMPFPALPYDDGARERLFNALGVRGVPTLIIVSGDGRVLQRDGRACVAGDPTAAGWPYEGVHAGGVTSYFTSLSQPVQWLIMGLVYVVARWVLWAWRGDG